MALGGFVFVALQSLVDRYSPTSVYCWREQIVRGRGTRLKSLLNLPCEWDFAK